MTLAQLWLNSSALLPELILVLAACAVILADMLVPISRSRRVCGGIALAGSLLAFFLVWRSPAPAAAQTFFDHTFVQDGLARVFKLVFFGGTIICLLFSLLSRELQGYRLGEYFTLIIGATVSAALLASSNNLVLFVLALETLSMCSYILAGFLKHERFSAEAGLKYMLYGAVTSGIMLFGLSYVYGLTGTLELSGAMQTLAMNALHGINTPATLLSVVLLLAGLGFKIAMVPFHFWCPYAYQGAPTPITAYLSVVSSAAGFSAILRLVAPLLQSGQLMLALAPDQSLGAVPVLFGLLALITMTYGNLVAIRQTDIKRLLAYSSIAQGGYLLMALSVFRPDAVEAMLMYIIIYLFMNLGAFWVAIVMINQVHSADIRHYSGFAFRDPFMFAVIFLCLISLTGLPPTAGFAGKFMLFKVVVGAGVEGLTGGGMSAVSIFYFTLALAGMINGVISLYYYMKIAKVMVFEKPEETPKFSVTWVEQLYGFALALPVLVLINFTPLVHLVQGVLPQTGAGL